MHPWHILLQSVVLPLWVPLQLAAQGGTVDILEADRATSASSSDSGLMTALSRSLADDGVVLWPGAPVVIGPGETRRLLSSALPRDSVRLTWQPLGFEIAHDSTLGMTWGVAVLSSRHTSNAPRIARYTTIWRNSAAGWTIAAILFMNVQPVTTRVPGIPLTRSPSRAGGPSAHFVAADLAFARMARDSGAVIAFRSWAAPNAFVTGGLLIRGPDAIASGVAGPARWRWHPVATGSSHDGNFGWTVGEAVITPEKGDANYSKYLTVWIRTPAGAIRFLTDGGNPRPATPSSGAAAATTQDLR
jgi:hypothetical protein